MTTQNTETKTVVERVPESAAIVKRHRAPSGNRDSDRFQPVCPGCGWGGAYYPNRTVEGGRLAQRDADQHRCSPGERRP